MRKQIELLEHEANMCAKLINIGGARVHIHAINLNISGLNGFKTVNRPDQGRLTGTRRPTDNDDFPPINLSIDIVQGLVFAVPFANIRKLYHAAALSNVDPAPKRLW